MDIDRALNILKENGYKYTGKREKMVNIFQEQERYLTAKECFDLMQVEYPGISFDTVYRNLSLFETLGIIETTEWDGERRYRFHCNRDLHHHHLICTKCGRTQMIKVCPMHAMFGKPENFQITGHKFEIYGICAECG